MNRTQANEIRVRLGLAPIVTDAAAADLARARKRQQNANRAARAQANRDLKSVRSKGKK